MDTKRKISILFIAAVLLYVIAFILFEFIQQRQHSLLYNSRNNILNQSVNAAMQLKLTALNTSTYDYTVWDEMKDFVQSRDSQWAALNIVSILPTYKVNAVWVYNLKKELVYSLNNFDVKQDIIPVPKESLDSVHLKKTFDFYLDSPTGLMLVGGSVVLQTNDLERKGAPQGYFFIGKSIDNDFLTEIGVLTGSSVTLSDIHHGDTIVTNPSQTKYIYPLMNWKGEEISQLIFIRDFPFVSDFFLFSSISRLLFIGIGLFVILAIYFLFNKWVSSPLMKINLALVSNDVSGIENLKKKKDEFGKLSVLLENFINQRKELEQQILEKIKTEKLLLESEEKFSKAYLFSPAAMMITSLEGNILLSANESFSKMTGLNTRNIINSQLDSLDVFNDPGLFTTIAESLKKQQTVSSSEIFIKTKSGDLRFGILKCDIVYLQGKPCLLSVIIDITDRKQVELKMKIAREKAEESDKLKYYLLMNMSHELRTPLTGIIGFAEVIKDDSNEKQIKSLANKILISSDRLLSTLNSIMLLAEIHSGSLLIQKHKFLMGSTIAGICDQFSEIADTKSIELVLDLKDVLVEVDPDYLKEIATRIIDNAIKFSDKGTVRVSVNEQIDEKGKYALLVVSDNGIGIGPEMFNDIFIEFRQLSEGVGRSFEGCGLGLAIAKHLTQLMGGEISVESRVGEGSSFFVKFPLAE